MCRPSILFLLDIIKLRWWDTYFTKQTEHTIFKRTFVSALRQPVECFFNWLNRLTSIQSASMIRSLSGLLSHVFARIAAALISLIFYP